MLTRTHTRTHVYVTFADPYLTCDYCGEPVTAWHDPQRCCDAGWWNEPCGHEAAVTSVCPSWSPVDGCRCMEHLGHVPHPVPSRSPSTESETPDA